MGDYISISAYTGPSSIDFASPDVAYTTEHYRSFTINCKAIDQFIYDHRDELLRLPFEPRCLRLGYFVFSAFVREAKKAPLQFPIQLFSKMQNLYIVIDPNYPHYQFEENTPGDKQIYEYDTRLF